MWLIFLLVPVSVVIHVPVVVVDNDDDDDDVDLFLLFMLFPIPVVIIIIVVFRGVASGMHGMPRIHGESGGPFESGNLQHESTSVFSPSIIRGEAGCWPC